ncbi:putative tRNA(His) guanylyltransferase [Helianthus annuus]|nr:putative tRNA(His) guanylyltransferase [Helianthus annuus]
MANSKYEYVKSFENEDEVMYPNLIVVRIDGRNFAKFSEVNEFEKPNDERALNLMNHCATLVLEKYPDIIVAYGFSDEYSFVFKKETKFYQRRASKILSLIVSLFTSLYVECFPHEEMRFTPSFKSRIICCPSMEVLQAYLAWRQRECEFSEVHGFEKPNDEQALKLMNASAVAVLEEFNDIVFAYGVSDEYSFVLKKNSELYQRRARSASCKRSHYHFFPEKELEYGPPPIFDGRAVCYPSYEIIRDYFAWRQVDCHINNQYNTCFWMLVKSGKSTREAQSLLKGTQAQEKNQMLSQLFAIDYNTLPVIFRNGSSVFWDKVNFTTDG